MALRFHPDKNIGLDTSKIMIMIIEDNDGLKNTLRTNDAIREEYRVRAAETAISLSSDDNSDSEIIKISPDQQHHLIKHPHFQLNTILIMKKYP